MEELFQQDDGDRFLEKILHSCMYLGKPAIFFIHFHDDNFNSKKQEKTINSR